MNIMLYNCLYGKKYKKEAANNIENKGFRDIEDFYSAHRERLREYLKIKKIGDDPKILMMHLGGIIVETYVKYIIKNNNDAKKVRGDYWYTERGFNSIMNNRNMPTKEYKNFSCYKNKRHSIEEAIKDVNDLNNRLTSIDIINDIKLVQNPLNQDRECFIDLRYKSSNNIDNLDEIYTRWEKSFKSLLRWLRENLEDVDV